MEKEKSFFFKDIIASIKDFDKYQEYANHNLSKGIKYFLKLTLLLVIVISVAFTIKIGSTFNNTINYLKSDSPYFKLENDKLYVEAQDGLVYDNIEGFNGLLVIDTREDISEEKMKEYKDKLVLYDNGIIALQDKLILRNMLLEGETTLTYKEIKEVYQIPDFTKEQVVEYFSGWQLFSIYISICIMLILIFFMTYILQLLIQAVAPMLFGYLTGRIMGLKLKATNIFNITVHAMTLSVILRGIYIIVNLFTGFYIQYFDIMYITIIYIYIVTALFIIRSTLIKQQIELMKIIEEQENVKTEIQEEKDKKKEEQEKKEKQEENKKLKDKEEKKEKDENEEDNNIGEEANGEV